MTMDELLGELSLVVPPRRARAILSRARRLIGLKQEDDIGTRDLLMILESVGAEGGALQEIAELLARRALDETPRPR